MAFDPKQFYRQANRMGRGTAEVSLRTAIGRLYYSMYLTARERPTVKAAMVGLPLNAQRSHGQLIRIVRSLPSHAGTASKLSELMNLRHCADYQLDPANSPEKMWRTRSNWQRNWQKAQVIVQDIYPKIKSL